MNKVDVAEFAALSKKTPRHIRNLCKEGRLPCQKIKLKTGIKYYVYLGTEEARRVLGENWRKEYSSLRNAPLPFGEEAEEVSSDQYDYTSFSHIHDEEYADTSEPLDASPSPSSGVPREETGTYAEVLSELVGQLKKSQDYIIETNRQLVEYAELAGQVKLLTDSEGFTRQKYFELQSENTVLKEENSSLKLQLEELKKINSDLAVRVEELGKRKFKLW